MELRRVDDAARLGRERQIHRRLAGEWTAPVQRLVQRDTEAELIGGLIDALPEELLRRHICGRAHQRPGAREDVVVPDCQHVDAVACLRACGVVVQHDEDRQVGAVCDGVLDVCARHCRGEALVDRIEL